jgi:hypothetical protein
VTSTIPTEPANRQNRSHSQGDPTLIIVMVFELKAGVAMLDRIVDKAILPRGARSPGAS